MAQLCLSIKGFGVGMVVLWLILACVFGAHGSVANLSDDPLLDVRTVASSSALQQAVSDGVHHIILTEHVDAGRPQTTAQTTGAIAYMQAIQVRPSTRSIVVCSADHACRGCPSTGLSRDCALNLSPIRLDPATE